MVKSVKNCPRIHVNLNKNKDIDLVIIDNAKQSDKSDIFKSDIIHNGLNIAENYLRKDDSKKLGNMNLVVADITFRISTGNHKDNHKRKFITFPIKIPGKSIYSMTDAFNDIREHLDSINSKIDDKSFTFKLMKERYNKGHNITGNNHCGHKPEFADIKGDHQYTYHSEQALFNYLSTKQASMMIVNRIKSVIRSDNLSNHGDMVKIYSAILHIHSTKTPCGPCERSIIGVHNSQDEIENESPQFLSLLSEELKSRENSSIKFCIPKNGIKMSTSFTANTHDSDHKSKREIEETTINLQDSDNLMNHVYLSNYNAEIDEEYLIDQNSDLSDRTVFTSASSKNRISPEVLSRTKSRINDEDKDIKIVRKLFQNASINK